MCIARCMTVYGAPGGMGARYQGLGGVQLVLTQVPPTR
jgi:hypothetical protein